jgi:hypothetical protein
LLNLGASASTGAEQPVKPSRNQRCRSSFKGQYPQLFFTDILLHGTGYPHLLTTLLRIMIFDLQLSQDIQLNQLLLDMRGLWKVLSTGSPHRG